MIKKGPRKRLKRRFRRGGSHRTGTILTSATRRKIERLFDRDGPYCWLCRERIDGNLKGEHPKRATIDHVIPKANGGENRMWNYRLAHAVCNGLRGTKTRDEFLEELKKGRKK